MTYIESPHNALVKKLRKLARPKKRPDAFLIEGHKLVSAATKARLELQVIVTSSARSEAPIVETAPHVPHAILDKNLFDAVSTLESPDGVLAIATRPSAPALPHDGVVVAVLGVQDPKNLGAIARVTEASGARGLLIKKGSVDPFSPKVVRGSMGSVFRLPVWEIEDSAALTPFRKVALVPKGGVDFRRFDWAPPLVVMLGAEGAGLTEPLTGDDALVTIPMRGEVDSLNVATAAALVLYEASRKSS